MKVVIGTFALTMLAASTILARSTTDAVNRIETANQVMQEIMAIKDKSIPDELLEKAHCIVIVPGLKKAGFVVGAEYGKGVMMCRESSGRGWTGPSTIRMEGGSFGLQIGGSETDLVMLVMNQRGAEKLMRSEFTLGGDATVAAGPVGRSAQADTDAYMHAEILAWSRSRGVFAGISLKGGTLRSDDDDNAVVYGKSVTHTEILEGKIAAPESANGLRSTLAKYSMREEK